MAGKTANRDGTEHEESRSRSSGKLERRAGVGQTPDGALRVGGLGNPKGI
jgi:hypothetical protein